jgi:hypothetical protein
MANPVYELNNWLSDATAHPDLAALLGHGSISADEYPPFYPVQASPQEAPDPFVRYVSVRGIGFHWVQETVTVNYAIYSASPDKLSDIENEIVKIIKGDESVTRWQNWHDAQTEHEPLWLFHDLRFVNATDLPPPDQEAADFGRLVVLRFDYANCNYIR